MSQITKRDMLDHIYQGDCIQIMNDLPKSCIDIIVTSPPYNIGIEYNKYNDSLPFEQYLNLMESFGNACFRVLKDTGSLFFNIGDKVTDEFRSFLVAQRVRGESLVIQNTIHWVKSIAVPEHNINIGHFKPVNSKRYINNCHEYIFHFTKSGNCTLDKNGIGVPYADKSNISRWGHTRGNDIRDRGNMWFIPYKTVQDKKQHPAMFPEKLPQMCIKLAGYNKKTIVLDPFCGSGSTLMASKRLGCKYIGIDVDSNYVKMAKKNVNFVV